MRKESVGQGISYPIAMSPPAAGGAPSPAFSRGSSLDREASVNPDGPDPARRVLRIKRLVCNILTNQISQCLQKLQVDGEWQIEIIRDAAVIRAYIRGRQLIEEEATLANSLAPTGDADKDKRAKKRSVLLTFAMLPNTEYLWLQARGGDRENEEESRKTTTSEERQDRQGRWYTNATEPSRQTRYDEAMWALRPNGPHEYVEFLYSTYWHPSYCMPL